MCAVFRRAGAPSASEPVEDGRAGPSLAWDAGRGDWAVVARCGECGGYRMFLQVRDEAHRDLAESRAAAFLSRIHERGGCLGCASRQWRESPVPAGGPTVWWDTETSEWIAWLELPGSAHGVSLPLGIRTFWAPQEVRAAARALAGGSRMPLRVASEPTSIDDDAPTIFYDVESGRWRLRVACFDCEGFELALTSFGRGAVEAACDEAIACLDLIAREGCPHCRTTRERCADRGETEEPRIWYDTVSRDWLMWQPLEGCEDGVTLPLGIPRFDARRALVYRSAASLLFDSQLFLDEGL